jgi:hypothetical protein
VGSFYSSLPAYYRSFPLRIFAATEEVEWEVSTPIFLLATGRSLSIFLQQTEGVEWEVSAPLFLLTTGRSFPLNIVATD